MKYYKALRQDYTNFYAINDKSEALCVTTGETIEKLVTRHTTIKKHNKALPFIPITKDEVDKNYNLVLAQNDNFLNP